MKVYLENVELGDGWFVSVIALGLILCAATLFQIKNRHKVDYSGVIWSLFVVVIGWGFFASTVGFTRAFSELDTIAPTDRLPGMLIAAGNAMTPILLSVSLALLTVFPMCWVLHHLKQNSSSQSAKA